jgi:hypothetical protein
MTLLELNSTVAALHLGGQICANCGAAFVCGMAAGNERCWCADLPPLMPVPDTPAGCYCPDCLRGMLDSGH